MDSPLDIQRRGAVAWLTLNRPDQGNSIDVAMAEALLEAARGIGTDTAVRAVVISGAGRMFCAGGDITTFTSGDDPKAAIDAITTPLHQALEGLVALDKPIVNLVNGAAAGAGLGLALLGDIVIAGRSAHFTSAYTAIGLTPDGSSSWFLPRLIGLRRATEMVLTNRRVGAEEAERLGMVTSVTDDHALISEGEAMSAQLAEGPIQAFANSRRLLSEGLSRGLTEQLQIEARTIAQSANSNEGREGVARFLRGRSGRPA